MYHRALVVEAVAATAIAAIIVNLQFRLLGVFLPTRGAEAPNMLAEHIWGFLWAYQSGEGWTYALSIFLGFLLVIYSGLTNPR